MQDAFNRDEFAFAEDESGSGGESEELEDEELGDEPEKIDGSDEDDFI